jgi:hypothetical protein
VTRAFRYRSVSGRSHVHSPEKEEAPAGCREVSGSVYERLDVSREIGAVDSQQLGETLLLLEGSKAVGFAVCTLGLKPKQEAGGCYAKFGAVRSGGAASRQFEQLLSACEHFDSGQPAERLVAGGPRIWGGTKSIDYGGPGFPRRPTRRWLPQARKVTTVRMGRLSPLISGPPHPRRHSSVPDALSSHLNIRRPCVMLMRAIEVGRFECCSMHPTNRRFGEVPGADSPGSNFYEYPAHVVVHDLAVTRFGR